MPAMLGMAGKLPIHPAQIAPPARASAPLSRRPPGPSACSPPGRAPPCSTPPCGYVLNGLRQGWVDLGLLSETLVLVGPRAAPDGGQPPPEGLPVSIRDLAALPLILPSPGHGLRDLLDERAAGLDVVLRSRIDIDAYGAIRTLVERGLGYSVLPAHAVRREAGLVRTWAFDPALTRTVHLLVPTTRPLSHAAHAVEDLCRLTLHELVRSGTWHAARTRVSVPGAGASDAAAAG